jgi:hypothetical protein
MDASPFWGWCVWLDLLYMIDYLHVSKDFDMMGKNLTRSLLMATTIGLAMPAFANQSTNCILTGNTGAEIFAYNNCLLNPPSNAALSQALAPQDWAALTDRLHLLEVANSLLTARLAALEALMLSGGKP